MNQPLLRDLINIPESLHKGDFVLKLSEGVEDAQRTLDQYVVTRALADNFDRALASIEKAMRGSTSQATYLDGSFGSGKSHFMAVLHLLLQNDLAARSKPELAPVIAQHGDWLANKKFLLVPFHMIGAESFTATVLGGYAEQVKQLHPEKPAPAVYRGEGLLEDAEKLRQQLGDESFLAGLAGSGDSGWGDLQEQWTAERYDAARQQKPGEPERQALVQDLISSYFSSYAAVASGQGEAFVDADAGLAIISRHAKMLGYDAVILFLDELILWLASRVADQGFVEREIQNIIKLVEAQDADRPVPLISFVARQRDLTELVGDHVPGAEKVRFRDSLKHWEGRFDKIKFEDRDLAEIAEKRLLRPKSDQARSQIDEAFKKTFAVSQSTLDVWLGASGDRQQFRRVYPFSPAILQTLVALSSMLQRERTAIKVMMQLLVDRRDTLTLGELIPIGDLYDAIADEADPFTEEIREFFQKARKLYQRKLLPMLERQHNLDASQLADLPRADASRRAFEGHDRLLKTLLLAALAPETEAFQNLTAKRLVALNHGSISSEIPGQEAADALQLCRRWASQIGELRVGSGDNPQISLKITGVDTEEILSRVAHVDNDGQRQGMVRQLLFDALQLKDNAQPAIRHRTHWRGTERQFDIAFGNVRKMSSADLQSRDDAWKIIFDYPFDTKTYSARDDLAAVESKQKTLACNTVVWLPSFWNTDLRKQLGDLVKIEYLLRGSALEENTHHLSSQHRQQAQQQLENQRDQLRRGLVTALEESYGIRNAASSSLVDPLAPEEQLQSFDQSLTLRLPAATQLADGLEKLIDQVCSHQHPSHPKFSTTVRPAAVRKVWTALEKIRQERLERLSIERKDRETLRQIVEPLGMAEVHETVLTPKGDWLQHLERQEALANKKGTLQTGKDGAAEPTVGDLRAWIQRSGPLGKGNPGLPELLEDLIIFEYAAANQRQFVRSGIVVAPELGKKLPADAQLQHHHLPSAETWEQARERAAALFGLPSVGHLTPRNVESLAQELSTRSKMLSHVHQLKEALLPHCRSFEAPEDSDRRTSLDDAIRLLDGLQLSDSVARIEALATVQLTSPPAVVGTTISQAESVLLAVQGTNWQLIEKATQRDQFPDREAELRSNIVSALKHHELTLPLVEALKHAEELATELLTDQPPDPESQPVPPGKTCGNANDLTAAAARQRIDGLHSRPGVRFDLSWHYDNNESS